MQNYRIIILAIVAFLAACTNPKESADSGDTTAESVQTTINIGYTLLKVYPHDTSSYTQGLVWYNNQLLEGTGWLGESKLLVADLATGKTSKKILLANDVFGEGITVLNNKIYQLTWKNKKAYCYDAKTFRKLNEFEWPYEGWGLTTNGQQLIISTGGSNIYFVNPETFKIEKTLGVYNQKGYVDNINELEYANGWIYANIYLTDHIVKINPSSGLIEADADFSSLLAQSGAKYDPRSIDEGYVLNGIAYDSTRQSFYITGKRWPVLAEIKFN